MKPLEYIAHRAPCAELDPTGVNVYANDIGLWVAR